MLAGGAYELRTVGAMTLRSLAWFVIALVALKAIGVAATAGYGSAEDPVDEALTHAAPC